MFEFLILVVIEAVVVSIAVAARDGGSWTSDDGDAGAS